MPRAKITYRKSQTQILCEQGFEKYKEKKRLMSEMEEDLRSFKYIKLADGNSKVDLKKPQVFIPADSDEEEEGDESPDLRNK